MGLISIEKYSDGLTSAALSGAIAPSTEAWPGLPPTCESADCRWDPITTISFCASVKNITSRLEIRQLEINNPLGGKDKVHVARASVGGAFGDFDLDDATAVGDLAINMTSPALKPIVLGVGNPKTPPNRPITVAFQDDIDLVNATVGRSILIYNNNSTELNDSDHRYRATEVLFHFCTKSLNVSVTNGVASTKVLSTKTKIQEWSVSADGWPFFKLAQPDNSQSHKEGFDICGVDSDKTENSMQDIFQGSYSSSAFQKFSIQTRVGTRVFDGVGAEMTVAKQDEMVWENAKQVVENIADSMTDL